MKRSDLAELEPGYELTEIKVRSPSWPSSCGVCEKLLESGEERGVLEFHKPIANGTAYKYVMVCKTHLPKDAKTASYGKNPPSEGDARNV